MGPRGPPAIPDAGPHIAVPFGKYLLIKRLAVGGMAELFLAQDDPEAPLVVIKRILPYLTNEPEFVRMFLDEARIAAQLHHPNIVQVYELGKLEDSIFIAMEYVEGVDLRKMLLQEQKGGASIDYAIAARIVADVCAGLHYAHHCTGVDGRKMEIVHRDVSPQNVMVGFDGRVKLVDFGIARANAFMERSQPGVLKGKFLYLSPEQVMQEPLDHRSDLFALGTLLYEITTGKAPFQRPTPEAVIFAIRREAPPSPQLVRADYPPELAAIVTRCLAKDRTQRYQDAAEIQADLEAFLAHTRPIASEQVGEYAQLLFGDEDERTILNIPTLQGSSQATLIAPPVLARPPARKLEPKPAPPPAAEPGPGTVSLRRTPLSPTPAVEPRAPEPRAQIVASPPPPPVLGEPVLGPLDATPLFTPRPSLDVQTNPAIAAPRARELPLEDRDTGELSISLANSAITESNSAPAVRASPMGGVGVGAPPPVIVAPPVPRRPTRMEQIAGAPTHTRVADFTGTLPPEATGSTTVALPPRRTGLKVFLGLIAAAGLVAFGVWLGRTHARAAFFRAAPAPAVAPTSARPTPAPVPSGAAPQKSAAPAAPARSAPATAAPEAAKPKAPAETAAVAAEPAPHNPSAHPKPALAHLVFRIPRGAVVEVSGRRVHSGSVVSVAAGRLRYTVRCAGRGTSERQLSVDPKSAKPHEISIRCPAKRAK